MTHEVCKFCGRGGLPINAIPCPRCGEDGGIVELIGTEGDKVMCRRCGHIVRLTWCNDTFPDHLRDMWYREERERDNKKNAMIAAQKKREADIAWAVKQAGIEARLQFETPMKDTCPACQGKMVYLGTHCAGETASEAFAACLNPACKMVVSRIQHWGDTSGPGEWTPSLGSSRDLDNYS